jgi:hypothetical protein
MGDIEAPFGYVAAFFALVIGNTPAVSTIVEVMFNPDSTTWIVSLAFSSVLEAISRTGISQRIELRSAAHLKAHFGIEWPIRTAEVSALKLVYLHSLGGTGYVTPIMALCIGCLRAATFSEPRAIIWLDVSPTGVGCPGAIRLRIRRGSSRLGNSTAKKEGFHRVRDTGASITGPPAAQHSPPPL